MGLSVCYLSDYVLVTLLLLHILAHWRICGESTWRQHPPYYLPTPTHTNATHHHPNTPTHPNFLPSLPTPAFYYHLLTLSPIQPHLSPNSTFAYTLLQWLIMKTKHGPSLVSYVCFANELRNHHQDSVIITVTIAMTSSVWMWRKLFIITFLHLGQRTKS